MSLDSSVVVDFRLSGNITLLEGLFAGRMLVADFVTNELADADIRVNAAEFVVLSGKFRPLQNHGCFLKTEPRIAWVELAGVSIAQVAEKIHFPLAVRKECGIQFICVETGHRSAI